MAKLEARPKIDMQVRLILNMDEALALDGLAGYGDDAFIKAFKEKLGTHYIRDHEAGLRSFLKAVRAELGFIRDFAHNLECIGNGTKVAVWHDSKMVKDEIEQKKQIQEEIHRSQATASGQPHSENCTGQCCKVC